MINTNELGEGQRDPDPFCFCEIIGFLSGNPRTLKKVFPCLSSGEWREREKERSGYPYSLEKFPMKNGEPVGAKNGVFQPLMFFLFQGIMGVTFRATKKVVAGLFPTKNMSTCHGPVVSFPP